MLWDWGTGLQSRSLPGARENQSYVVGLFVGPNPIINCCRHEFTYAHQGQALVFADQINKALFAKFAAIVLGLRNSIALGPENISRYHLCRTLIRAQIFEEAYPRTTGLQAADRSILS